VERHGTPDIKDEEGKDITETMVTNVWVPVDSLLAVLVKDIGMNPTGEKGSNEKALSNSGQWWAALLTCMLACRSRLILNLLMGLSCLAADTSIFARDSTHVQTCMYSNRLILI
jgi:hypothetical protein